MAARGGAGGDRRLMDATGNVIIPGSQRADGSWRKPIRVKPGYLPPEEVAAYKPGMVRERETAASRHGPGPIGAAYVDGGGDKPSRPKPTSRTTLKRDDSGDEGGASLHAMEGRLTSPADRDTSALAAVVAAGGDVPRARGRGAAHAPVVAAPPSSTPATASSVTAATIPIIPSAVGAVTVVSRRVLGAATPAASTTVTAAPTGYAAPAPAVVPVPSEAGKPLKKLRKLLREVEELEKEVAKGGTLNPDQTAKLGRKGGLLAEIARAEKEGRLE